MRQELKSRRLLHENHTYPGGLVLPGLFVPDKHHTGGGGLFPRLKGAMDGAMKKACKLLAVMAVFLLSGCTATGPHPPVGVTFLPVSGDILAHNGTRSDMATFTAQASESEFVLVGEGHKNPCDHRMQVRLVRQLADAGLDPAIGLEMVAVDKQPVLDRFNAGEIEVADIADKLDWQKAWGYPFTLFEPLFALARERRLPVFALNSPKRVITAVSDGGLDGIVEGDRGFAPREVVEPPEAQREFLGEAFAQHGEQLQNFEGEFKRFLLVQSVWDSMMAERALAVREQTGRLVVIIAGAGHVEFGWGVAYRLKTFVPESRVLSLTPNRDHLFFDPDEADLQFHCPDEYASRLGMVLQIFGGAVTVVEIRPEGRAATSGLRPGDVLAEAQGFQVRGFRDLHRAGKRAHDRDERLIFIIERRNQRLKIDLGRLGKDR